MVPQSLVLVVLDHIGPFGQPGRHRELGNNIGGADAFAVLALDGFDPSSSFLPSIPLLNPRTLWVCLPALAMMA